MRPDHTLQDDTRLRFLVPHATPTDGLAMVRADLTAFFVIVGSVGRNEALLLLLVRALRQRTGHFALRMNDLAWTLRVSNRTVIRMFDALAERSMLVYHVEDFWGVDTVIVEIVGKAVVPHTFERTIRVDLPTNWFVQVLPIIGRTTFTVFLYFLFLEPQRNETHIDHLVETVALRGRLHAHWHLRRLRARGMLRPEASGGVVVRDPELPTRFQRLQLRFLAVPTLRRSLAHLVVLTLLVLVLTGLLLLLHLAPNPPYL